VHRSPSTDVVPPRACVRAFRLPDPASRRHRRTNRAALAALLTPPFRARPATPYTTAVRGERVQHRRPIVCAGRLGVSEPAATRRARKRGAAGAGAAASRRRPTRGGERDGVSCHGTGRRARSWRPSTSVRPPIPIPRSRNRVRGDRLRAPPSIESRRVSQCSSRDRYENAGGGGGAIPAGWTPRSASGSA
jgi:hypothetical protein